MGESDESSLGCMARYFDSQFLQMVYHGEEVNFKRDCFCFTKKKRQMDLGVQGITVFLTVMMLALPLNSLIKMFPLLGISSHSEMKALSSTPG